MGENIHQNRTEYIPAGRNWRQSGIVKKPGEGSPGFTLPTMRVVQTKRVLKRTVLNRTLN